MADQLPAIARCPPMALMSPTSAFGAARLPSKPLVLRFMAPETTVYTPHFSSAAQTSVSTTALLPNGA